MRFPLLLILCLLLLVGSVQAVDLTSGLSMHWEMNSSTTPIPDFQGSTTLTVEAGVPVFSSGTPLGGNFRLDGTDDKWIFTTANTLGSQWSLCSVIAANSSGQDLYPVIFRTATDGDSLYLRTDSVTEHVNFFSDGTRCTANHSIQNKGVVQVCFTIDDASNERKIYINGSLSNSCTDALSGVTDAGTHSVGGRSGAADYDFGGNFFQMSIWNNTILSLADIAYHYNSGSFLPFTDYNGDADAINITANLPTDNDHTNDNPVNFTFNANSTSGTLNYSLYINGTLNRTLLNQAEGDSWFNVSMADGTYTWYVSATSNSITENTTTRTIIVDSTAPDWTIAATNFFASDNSTVIGDPAGIQTFNLTLDDLYLFAFNITITAPNSSIMWQEVRQGLTTSLENITNSTNMSTWGYGTFTVDLVGEDDHTARTIPSYSNRPIMSGYEWTTDTGVTIRVTSPGATLTTEKLDDRYTFTSTFSGNRATSIYLLASSAPLHHRSSLYPFPSFVTGRHWVDFNTAQATGYAVTDQGFEDGWYQYHVRVDSNPSDTFLFESLGGLNYANESYFFSIVPAAITLTSVLDTNGNVVSGPFTLAANGTNTNGSLPLTHNVSAGIHTTVTNKTGWFDDSRSINATDNTTTFSISTFGNTFLNVTGDVSGNLYYPSCNINGTYYSHANNYYTLPTGNHTLNCDAGSSYSAFSVSANKTADTTLVVNHTVSEFVLMLNFSEATNGTIYYRNNTDDNLTGDVTYWNGTIYQYVRITSRFPEDDIITFVFNDLGNNGTAQYYQYLNDYSSQQSDNILVLDQLDGVVRINVLSYANEVLHGATVRFTVENGTSHVVQQRLTSPFSGTAHPGDLFYLDDTRNYLLTVTKEGHTPYQRAVRAIDFDNDLTFTVALPPTDASFIGEHLLYGMRYHANESTLPFLVAHIDSGTVYWNTSLFSTPSTLTLVNGGGAFSLTNGVHFTNGSSVTTYLYTYNATTNTYTQVATFTTTYFTDRRYNPFASVTALLTNDATRALLNGVLWALVIVLSALIGAQITKEGSDVGYGAFIGGTLTISLISTLFLPVAGVLLLTLAADSFLNATKE